MALLLKALYQGYRWVIDDLGDPRAKELYFMASPLPIVLLLYLFYMFVRVLGPNHMQNRQPYNLKNILIVYNFIQVLANLFIFLSVIPIVASQDKVCAIVDFSRSYVGTKSLDLIYYYFLLKLSDLLDTIFFVLRKKYAQVSFLNIYHHMGMVVFSWIAATFAPGGETLYIIIINTFIHVVMYFYYMVSIMGYKPSLWVKKTITQMQLTQFLMLVLLACKSLLNPSCQFSKVLTILFLPQNILMIALFSEFYYKTYIKSNKRRPAANMLINNNSTTKD